MVNSEDYGLKFDAQKALCADIYINLNKIYSYNQQSNYNIPHLRSSIFKNMETFDVLNCVERANFPKNITKINQEHITGKYTKSPYGAFYHMNLKDGVLNLTYEF
jgi:hypothetical protein